MGRRYFGIYTLVMSLGWRMYHHVLLRLGDLVMVVLVVLVLMPHLIPGAHVLELGPHSASTFHCSAPSTDVQLANIHH